MGNPVVDMGDTNSTSSCSSTTTGSGDENTKRGNWVGRLDFMMSCISYAVGLGNIWRFPYLCYRNGGAVFLVPYFIFLILCGMPLFFLEVSYGQFASLSPITIWRLSPLFKGIGYGMVLISAIVCIYYNIIITWTVYYLFKSFSTVLPWSTCNNWWNTEACVTRHQDILLYGNNSMLNDTLGNSSLINSVTYTSNTSSLNDSILTVNATYIQRKSSSEEFWERHVLQISDGIEDMGGIRWELFGCLAFAWVVVFLCLIKGVRSSGRVVYFTATFPYIVLCTLLVRGVTLPGATKGLSFYLVPQWHKLLSLTVWGEAAMQIFYSVGACWGALVTMASYNKFHHDCYKDAKIVPLLNCGTSVFAGFTIFSIIGFMAHETGTSVDKVITQGPGLVFVVYPEAVSRLPVSQLWSVMFFLMLFSVGIGSQIAMFQTVTFAFFDEFPILRSKKILFTACFCLVEFLFGIPCVTNGGIYFLQIMDWYSSTFSLMVLSLTECLVIAWIYGVERFYQDIELMVGYRPCLWWKILWCGVTPVLIVFILSFSIISHTPVTYGDYSYPGWAIFIGWIFALCSIVPLPVIAVIKVLQAKGSIIGRVKELVKPSSEWGPALQQHRELYIRSLKGKGDTVLPELTEKLTVGNTQISVGISDESMSEQKQNIV